LVFSFHCFCHNIDKYNRSSLFCEAPAIFILTPWMKKDIKILSAYAEDHGLCSWMNA